MFPSPSTARPTRQPRRAAGALLAFVAAALVLVAGCGGGTSQFEPFVPLRLFAFGDEASALTTESADGPAGRNYGINAKRDTKNTPDDTSDDEFDCTLQPNWVQSMASLYGFFFAECRAGRVDEPQARNRAAAGARVAEVAAQVEAQVADGGFRDKDISTVFVGVNDIVELYRLYDGSNEAALLAQARERGNRAAQIVNRLVELGTKVVVSNIPDMGFTPLAKNEGVANPGADRAGLLSRLSSAFNERLGVTIVLDGRFVALAQTDQRILAINRSPASFLISNTVDAACATPPPACFNDTLAPDANASTYLWASDRLLSARGQAELAQLALTRAQRNPF